MNQVIQIITCYGEVCGLLEKSDKAKSYFKKLMIIQKLHYIKKMCKKMNFSNTIEKNSNIMEGKAVIKGTRITTETIVHCVLNINAEQSDEKIIAEVKKQYPGITEVQIVMALIYYIKETKYSKILFSR